MARYLLAASVAAIVVFASAETTSAQCPLPEPPGNIVLRMPEYMFPTPMPPSAAPCSGASIRRPYTGPRITTSSEGRTRSASFGQVIFAVPGYHYPYGYPYRTPYRLGYPYAHNYMPSIEDETEQSEKTWALQARSHKSSSQATKKCHDQIAAGNELFAEGQYGAAGRKYRAAARLSPELAEPQFLHALALLAQENNGGAVRAFRRGLQLRTPLSDLSFTLERLAGAEAASAISESIVARMEAKPQDAILMAARGMQLYFSGERARAGLYLTQAAQLGTLDEHLVRALLPFEEPVAAAAPRTGPLEKVGF